jgi:hypothetical protein
VLHPFYHHDPSQAPSPSLTSSCPSPSSSFPHSVFHPLALVGPFHLNPFVSIPVCRPFLHSPFRLSTYRAIISSRSRPLSFFSHRSLPNPQRRRDFPFFNSHPANIFSFFAIQSRFPSRFVRDPVVCRQLPPLRRQPRNSSDPSTRKPSRCTTKPSTLGRLRFINAAHRRVSVIGSFLRSLRRFHLSISSHVSRLLSRIDPIASRSQRP